MLDNEYFESIKNFEDMLASYETDILALKTRIATYELLMSKYSNDIDVLDMKLNQAKKIIKDTNSWSDAKYYLDALDSVDKEFYCSRYENRIRQQIFKALNNYFDYINREADLPSPLKMGFDIETDNNKKYELSITLKEVD